MANAQINAAFPHDFFWQQNGVNNDGAANQGPVHPHHGQQDNNYNGGPANDDASPEIQEVNGPPNVAPANHGQEHNFEERMVTITPRVMRMWADGHAIAKGNEGRVAQGLVPLVHPPMSRWHRGLLVLLAEERRAELRRQWQELNEVEKVLGINYM
ncbi:hypothetical protein BDR05DRAFT_953598 [Suillus weaverae]|nr:hypothetical protein BDR05DRAFT_953598 [Suillus weaverae]